MAWSDLSEKQERQLARELWHLRDVYGRLWQSKMAPGSKASTAHGRAVYIKERLKAQESVLRTKARKPANQGGGWHRYNRAARFQLVYGTRINDRKFHPSHWSGSGPPGIGTALVWARSQIGTVERPAGSNGGPGISDWQRAFGFGRVPWCGIFVGTAYRRAGLEVNSRIAGVALIEDDARHGRNCFKDFHGSSSGLPGDAAILFGYGVHVGIIEKKVSGGYWTIEGNTSKGDGSQSNGGGVHRRFRSYGSVRGCARPKW